MHGLKVGSFGETVSENYNGIMSLFCQWQLYNEIHGDLFPAIGRCCQGLQKSSRMLITWFISLTGITRLNIFLDILSHLWPVVESGGSFYSFVYSQMSSDLNIVMFSQDVGSQLFVKRDDKAMVFFQVDSLIFQFKVSCLGFFFFISVIRVLECF